MHAETRLKTKGLGITVIIPALNEEKNIANVIRVLQLIGFSNILVIDGNSTDRTREIAAALGVRVANQNGRGKGDALRHAFGLEGVGDRVVMIDADGSMDPSEIILLLNELDNGADIVKGSRFLPRGFSEDMTLFRRLGNKVFVALVNLIWSANYTDLCYGFAAFKKNALDEIYPHLKSKNFEIEAELFIIAKKLGLKVKEVPSYEKERKYGKSNLNGFRDGLQILKTILQEAFRS